MTEFFKSHKKLIRGILVGLGAFIIALLLGISGLLDRIEFIAWDLRVNTFASPGKATDDIVVVGVDQSSLNWSMENWGAGWPWPREYYQVLTNYFERAGAKAVAFDIFYFDPSQTGVEDDERFGDALFQFKKAVGAVALAKNAGKDTAWPYNTLESDIKIIGFDNWYAQDDKTAISFPTADFPISEIGPNYFTLADVSNVPDSDKIFRRSRLFSVFDDKPILSLALATYLAGEKVSPRLEIKDNILKIGTNEIQIDNNVRITVNYRGPSATHKFYSAAKLIQSELQILEGEKPDVDPAQLKDKYVFIGFTAAGLKDLRSSPTSESYAGVEIHATVLDNLLSNDFIKTTPSIIILLFVLLISVIVGMLSSVSGTIKNVSSYLGLLFIAVAAGFVAYPIGYNFPIVQPLLAVLITIMSTTLLNYAFEGRQKRFIKGAFKHYLSPAVIDQLLANPNKLKLGGERRELTIFFSDLQGFTSISELLTPEELTALLNDYLSAMTDIIQEEGGTVDKYEGDAIIAFWNAPIDIPDHAERAVRATLRCQQKLAELRPEYKMRAGRDLLMRIGLNTGQAVVGNMGSHSRFDYTMLGDAVNLAARLEGINKQFNTYTMISKATKEKMKDLFPCRELSRVAVVGKKEAIVVYEPFFQSEFEQKAAIFEVFAQGLDLFYKGNFSAAKEIFVSTADKDPTAAAYTAKCDELLKNPPQNWQGVWVMTSK